MPTRRYLGFGQVISYSEGSPDSRPVHTDGTRSWKYEWYHDYQSGQDARNRAYGTAVSQYTCFGGVMGPLYDHPTRLSMLRFQLPKPSTQDLAERSEFDAIDEVLEENKIVFEANDKVLSTECEQACWSTGPMICQKFGLSFDQVLSFAYKRGSKWVCISLCGNNMLIFAARQWTHFLQSRAVSRKKNIWIIWRDWQRSDTSICARVQMETPSWKILTKSQELRQGGLYHR
jgi:hypothetical protein